MRTIFIAESLLILSLAGLTGTCAPRAREAATETPRLELVAVSVSDADRSIAWYAAMLSLEVTGRNDYDGGITVAFLEGPGLRLEIVELADAVPFAAPDEANPATRHGIVKLTFAVDDPAALAQRAEQEGARVLFPLALSEQDGACYVTLTDPDGHWIQFKGPCENVGGTG